MKYFVHSLSTDVSNDEHFKKVNPLTVIIFGITQHKVFKKFLDMYNITSTTPAAIFSSNGRVTVKNETP